MNKLRRLTEIVMFAWFFAMGAMLMGCEEGPMEEAGEEIDDAVDDIGDALD